MHDVIVCDEEFESSAAAIRKACNSMETYLGVYIRIMDRVCENGITSGNTASAIRTYLSYAKRLRDVADEIASAHSESATLLLKAIDAADTYLY